MDQQKKICKYFILIFMISTLYSCQNQIDSDSKIEDKPTTEVTEGVTNVVEEPTEIETPMEVEPSNNLVGTQWKLAGILDTQTGVLKELEPKDCDRCYTLTFDTDTSFSTYSSSNELGGGYIVDYVKYSYQIIYFGGTKVGEWGDGPLYVDPFWKRDIQSFSYKENELKLFYNENKNYLLFKLQKS